MKKLCTVDNNHADTNVEAILALMNGYMWNLNP